MPLALGWYHFGCRNFPIGDWSGGSPPSVQVTLVYGTTIVVRGCDGLCGSQVHDSAALPPYYLLMVSGTTVLFDVSLLLLLNSTAVGAGAPF